MTNREAAKILREWHKTPHGHFSWPFDGDYEQHIKYVTKFNEFRFKVPFTEEEYIAFQQAYADELEKNEPST